jgi:hypothetical protein
MDSTLLLKLLTDLVKILIDQGGKNSERRFAQLKALAAFLDDVAECLEQMHAKLSEMVVPTAAGNRLKTQIRDYTEVVSRSVLDERTRLALGTILVQVRHCMFEGQVEDDILRGHVLRQGQEARRTALLSSLERTAARARGEADLLRAKAA